MSGITFTCNACGNTREPYAQFTDFALHQRIFHDTTTYRPTDRREEGSRYETRTAGRTVVV